jgi:hypothetical protein
MRKRIYTSVFMVSTMMLVGLGGLWLWLDIPSVLQPRIIPERSSSAASSLKTDSGTPRASKLCGSCHIMRRYVTSFATSQYLDHAHLRAGLGCTACHANGTGYDHIIVAVTYFTTNAPTVTLPRRLGDVVCNNCHVSMHYEATRTDYLTRNPHASHWPELQCEDCHRAHGAQIDFCAGCHDNGGQRMTGETYRADLRPAE